MLTGGKPIGDKGYYIEPTIFTNVKVNFSNKYVYENLDYNVMIKVIFFNY